MEILVITWNFPPRRGGMESLLSDLCQALREKHSLSVITAYAPTDQAVEEDVFRPKWPGLLPFSLYALFKGAMFLYQNPAIKVIFGGSATVAPLVLILARLFQRKAVIQVHGLDLLYPSAAYQFLCVRWLRYCDRIIANSRYTASLAETKKARKNSVAFIPPGVRWERFNDPESAERLKSALGLDGRQLILFVGRLARRKGIKEFIENSLVKVVAEVPESCFVIVGQNPSESLTHREDVASEIRAAIAASGLESHVCMLGWLNDADVAKIFQICDLMVLPALPMKEDVEGFGIVLLEAAAASKPVVATRVGGIPDAVEDGKSGILVHAQDYEELSMSIVKLLRDEDARFRFGEYARKRVKEEFSWDKISLRYEKLLADPEAMLHRKNV